MATGDYTPEAIKNFNDWEESITLSNRLRKRYPAVMLDYSGVNMCKGYYDYCKACGTKIYVEFGEYNVPVTEKFVKCPISEDPGHGIWASAVHVISN